MFIKTSRNPVCLFSLHVHITFIIELVSISSPSLLVYRLNISETANIIIMRRAIRSQRALANGNGSARSKRNKVARMADGDYQNTTCAGSLRFICTHEHGPGPLRGRGEQSLLLTCRVRTVGVGVGVGEGEASPAFALCW